jgi:hypothetical protein
MIRFFLRVKNQIKSWYEDKKFMGVAHITDWAIIVVISRIIIATLSFIAWFSIAYGNFFYYSVTDWWKCDE